ncbi:MAG TPA: primosomal protein N' [Ktedonobacterales bacterium]|nr:primosomal protein N' [Ktedonobacterales bacterium]
MRVEVAILRPAPPAANGLITYRAYGELASSIQPGCLVSVPYGDRGTLGVVWAMDASDEAGGAADVDDGESSGVRLREVSGLALPEPALSASQRALAEWIADYYWVPVGMAARLLLPPGLASSARSVVRVVPNPAESVDGDLPEDAALTLALLRDEGAVERLRLEEAFGAARAREVTRTLVRRGLASLATELPPAQLKPRRERRARLAATPEALEALEALEAWRAEARARLDASAGDGRTAHGRESAGERILRQLAALDALERAREPWRVEDLRRLARVTPSALSELERAGLIAIETVEARRDPMAGLHPPRTQPLTLTAAQRGALDAILDPAAPVDESGARVILLHGITGSDKTEVYLQALAAVIARGQRGLALVPEIALTPQAMARYAGRFPGRVALLHSGLSDAERLSEWRRIRAGEVDVVLGSRSALFAPIENLGLIVVDEEHEGAYKQENRPSYHAREVAVKLGALTGAPVVLGSATPSMEAWRRARDGSWRLVEMAERAGLGHGPEGPAHDRGETGASPEAKRAALAGLPPVTIVDLRAELREGNASILSATLRAALTETLQRGEQALMFLNRRGTATAVICRECGYTARCPQCDVSLTYHADHGPGGALVCHYCGRREATPQQCPMCWSASIRYFGLGAQRVEATLKRLYPEARVLRWDRDTARTRQEHEELLRLFAERRADVLVGTQMIAKGLDLPAVTLVGVISADVALTLPDFRASERAFQLLTQVAGRAGRAAAPGRVIVQTFNPEHFCIQTAAAHDYATFSEVELAARERYGYPPYRRLVKLMYASHDRYAAQVEATALSAALERVVRERALPDTDVVGPAPAFIERLRGRYRWQVILRGPDPVAALRALSADTPWWGWSVDVDSASSL